MNWRPLLGAIALIAVWQLATLPHFISGLILPTPTDVMEAMASSLVVKADLWPDIAATLARASLGLTLALVGGIPSGLLMGLSLSAYQVLVPLVDFFRSIPPVVLVPIFLLMFGLGESSRIGIIIYSCYFVIVVNSAYGVLHASPLRRAVGRIYGLSRSRIIVSIVFRDALPQIIVGLRTAVSLSLVLGIVSEVLMGAQHGLGKRIFDYGLLFQTPEMYAAIAVLGVIGYLINYLVFFLGKRLVHWL